MKFSTKLSLILLILTLTTSCVKNDFPEKIDLAKNWCFSPDEKNIGLSEKWYSVKFDDSKWDTLDVGTRWENQGYPDLDSIGWYRKAVNIPTDWKGEDIWIKFGAVNDAYELFINGESVSIFGQANISVANRPTFTKINENLKYGENNQIVLRVNDWGNSGGLWRLPAILTIDENEVNNIFKPMSPTHHTPESLGYELFWEDQFDGNKLDPEKWAPRAIGPRRGGYNSTEAIKVKDGFLELSALQKGDSILAGAVGTQDLFMTKYGYFECRSQLQKSKGVWAAFWIQSTGISAGEDPGKYGTEIDIFEFFKGFGEDMVSHNLHWAYGPNQQTIGALLSHHEGVSEGFHTISLEWTPEKYAFFVDGYKYHEVTRAISHIDEYMILSMELPGKEELKAAILPDVFKVDYVKVYKKK
jgi:Glycosyl hydrolases family 16/Glycosyl hydrolases family 2, sugar binding domain